MSRVWVGSRQDVAITSKPLVSVQCFSRWCCDFCLCVLSQSMQVFLQIWWRKRIPISELTGPASRSRPRANHTFAKIKRMPIKNIEAIQKKRPKTKSNLRAASSVSPWRKHKSSLGPTTKVLSQPRRNIVGCRIQHVWKEGGGHVIWKGTVLDQVTHGAAIRANTDRDIKAQW